MNLKAMFPWPAERPDVAPSIEGWLHPDTQALLQPRAATAKVIVEVGTWFGLSARFMLDQNPQSRLYCIDTWLGSYEHFECWESFIKDKKLYETFLASCWDYRDRIVPVRLDSVSGIKLVAKAGIVPDFVYLDGGHQFEVVSADLREITKAWAGVPVVCDDYGFPGPAQACAESGRPFTVNGWAATVQ